MRGQSIFECWHTQNVANTRGAVTPDLRPLVIEADSIGLIAMRINTSAGFDHHLAQCPADCRVPDAIHALEMLLLAQQALFFCASLRFIVEITNVSTCQGLIAADIKDPGDTDTFMQDVGNPCTFEALHLQSCDVDLNHLSAW